MFRILTLVLIFSAIIGGGFYVTAQKRSSEQTEVGSVVSARDYAVVEELLDNNEPFEALRIITHYLSSDFQEGDIITKNQWVEKAVIAYEAVKDPINLLHLYRRYPTIFADREDASLLISSLRVYSKRSEAYREVRELWRGRETKPNRWFLLDIDFFMAHGDYEQAQKLVDSQVFEGREEANRLIRLGWLQSRKNLQEAWNTMSQAQKIAPDYPEVRTRRAQLAEKARNFSLAQREFQAAFQLDPYNPIVRDQLAEFYRRHQQYKMALATWGGGLDKPSADIIWLKTLFWNKMVYPVQVDWQSLEVPFGRYHDLVTYFLQIPQNAFWDQESFNQLKQQGTFLAKRQETFWMKVLAFLQQGQEKEALELLNNSPFRERSWHPELSNPLYRRSYHHPQQSVEQKNYSAEKQFQ